MAANFHLCFTAVLETLTSSVIAEFGFDHALYVAQLKNKDVSNNDPFLNVPS